MFELADFYKDCAAGDVDLMPYSGLPMDACTVRDNGCYCVAINFKRLRSLRHYRTILMHEAGHVHTGALHKVVSPSQLVAQQEYRADADSFRRYLPPEELQRAMAAGYTEPWQLAEYFDLDEAYIKKALHYWTECRAVSFGYHDIIS